MKMNKLLSFTIALALCAGVFLCHRPCRVYASDAAETQPSAETETTAAETLSVDSVWLDGDALHITVSDTNTGLTQTLELDLREHANSGDEFISVQAVDKTGNISNAIQFKNPYYSEPVEVTGNTDPNSDTNDDGSVPDGGENEAENGSKPLSPDGTGTVIDDVDDGDGKEFFSIETGDGNVFYLIVDRQRSTENVYLLNAVTEQDLAALSEDGDISGGAIPAPETTAEPETAPADEESADEEPEEPSPKNSNTGTLIFIAAAALAAGGVGYYFKILKPKKAANSADDYDEPEDFDDADIYGETEGGGDE